MNILTATIRPAVLSSYLILCSGWCSGQNIKNAAHVPIFVTVMRPHGFEPSSVTLDARHFLLTVYNRTGLSLAKLTLAPDQVHAPAVKQVDIVPATPHYTDILDLSPGTYILTEADHPQWTCKILVK
jgi:hypothetical protein